MDDQETVSTPPTKQERGPSWPVVLGLLVLGLQGIRTIAHTDFWTHLATGRWMASHGIPATDPFTLVSGGNEWTHVGALYDRLLYALWSAGGAPLVILIHLAAVVGAFALAARVARPYASSYAIGLGLCLSAWLLAPRFEVRPDLLGLLFASIFFYTLSKPRIAWPAFAILIPTQILWANTGFSFVWGPILTLLFAIHTYCHTATGNRSAQQWTKPGLLVVALLIASCFTSNGPAIYPAAAAAWGAPQLIDWISPVSGHFSTAFSRSLITLSLIIGAGGLLTRKERLPIGLTAIAVISAFLVVRSMPTHIHWFALLAFPFFCLSLESMGRFVSLRLRTLSFLSGTTLTRLTQAALILVTVFSVFLLTTNRYYTATGHFAAFGLGVASDVFPEQAARILSHPDFPERTLNLPMDGGYLAWATETRSAFIDQRGALHDAAAYRTLAQGLRGAPDEWESLMTVWAPDAAVVNNLWIHSSDAVRHLLQKDTWQAVYFDGLSTVFVRDAAMTAAMRKQLATDKQTGLQQLEAHRQAYQNRLGGLTRPSLPPALIGAAGILQGSGYYRHAAACYELVYAGAPRMRTMPLNLGICQTRLGEYEASQQVLSAIMDELPSQSHPWMVAHLHQGINHIGLNNFAQAIRHLRLVTDYTSDNVQAWLQLGLAYEAVGQRADARQALARARELNPELTESFLDRVPPSQ